MKPVKQRFFDDMKSKPFYIALSKWFRDPKSLSDTQAAKALSSMVTHSVIEMEKSEVTYSVLDVPFQVDVLSMFVKGEITRARVRELYYDRFGKFFPSAR